jgi:Na+-driven multidrug efflux pump
MGIGRMKLLVFNILSMATINIILNWVFIHGHWGFPPMGVRGSALASNIAEIIAASVFAIYTFTGKFNVKYYLFRWSHLSRSVVYNVSRLSAPIVGQTLIGLIAWSVFFYFIEKMGPYDMAISSAAKNIYMFFGLFAWGFSTSANTIISNLMGQQQQQRVVQAIKNILVLSFGCQVLTVIPIVWFPENLLSIYTNDAALIHDTIPVLYVCVAALLVYSVSTILFHCIVSTGSVKSSFVIEVITIAIYMAFVYWIFSVQWKTVTIVWTAEVFYWLLLAICTIIYLQSGRWKTTRI